MQHGIGLHESTRRGSCSDLVNAGLHSDAGIGLDANTIKKEGAVDAADFIFTVDRKRVFNDSSRHTQRNAAPNIRILIGAAGSQSHEL